MIDQLKERLRLAVVWITEIAQVKTETLPEGVTARHKHSFWKGCLKGEYSVARKKWWFFCPVWHTGQALKALCLAQPFLNSEKVTLAGRLCADFLLANTVEEGADAGLLLAYEDDADQVNTSAILEALDGWLYFFRLTGERKYLSAAVKAADWVARKAYLKGEGLFLDCYDPARKEFIPSRFGVKGRPLLDDAIFLKMYSLTGEKLYRQIFLETAERLLQDEDPVGNWVDYPPASRPRGSIHPRHAYWWGRPFLSAYRETGKEKYLACAQRSAGWYQKAMRADGGLFRNTYLDFNTASFGHATSGVACAVILWLETDLAVNQPCFAPQVEKAVGYLLRMQFLTPSDPNLTGCILEKVMPPDGTDASPYHIRDLGTIFFV
ncbi:MAG TPA: hypothetical protein PK644_08545, partial [bacterium]|nr:hypothetical protein [bacterium]